MKENKIIENLDDIWTFGHEPTYEERLAANKAIDLIQELQQYRAIGTVEECREARERQRAKKPNGRYKTRHMWDGAYCPMCRCGITARWNFCQSCGQAIDWSDTQ